MTNTYMGLRYAIILTLMPPENVGAESGVAGYSSGSAAFQNALSWHRSPVRSGSRFRANTTATLPMPLTKSSTVLLFRSSASGNPGDGVGVGQAAPIRERIEIYIDDLPETYHQTLLDQKTTPPTSKLRRRTRSSRQLRSDHGTLTH